MSSSDNGKEGRPGGPANVATLEGRVKSSGDTAVGDHHLERLATSFEVSARRWELVVYPALFAFIVLACYGFYLIYNLTHDVGQLARNVSSLTASVDSMAHNLNDITGDMNRVTTAMNSITGAMGEVSTKMDSLEPMRQNMASMDQSTRYMATSAERMGYYMGELNHNVGRPMGAMGSFMPW